MKKTYFSRRGNYTDNSDTGNTRFVIILGRDSHTKSLKDNCLGNCHPEVCNTSEGIACLSFPAGKMVVIEPSSLKAPGWTVLCTSAPNTGALSYHGSCNGNKTNPKWPLDSTTSSHLCLCKTHMLSSSKKKEKEKKEKEKGRHLRLIPLLIPWNNYSTIIIVK